MKIRFRAFGFVFDFFINNYPEWEWFKKNKGRYCEANDNDGYEARVSPGSIECFAANDNINLKY